MPTATLMKKTATSKVTEPVLHVNLDISLEEQIAQRAHELWHHGGRKPGSDLTNWFQAEREVSEWHKKQLKKD
jgi:coproporphyrinogen III oxidase